MKAVWPATWPMSCGEIHLVTPSCMLSILDPPSPSIYIPSFLLFVSTALPPLVSVLSFPDDPHWCARIIPTQCYSPSRAIMYVSGGVRKVLSRARGCNDRVGRLCNYHDLGRGRERVRVYGCFNAGRKTKLVGSLCSHPKDPRSSSQL